MRDHAPTARTAPPARQTTVQRHFPVLFLSDLHLGSRACKEDALLAFLQAHTADLIYLVGDIVDTWTAVGSHWTPTQHRILQLLLDRAADGSRVIYIPGNHDAFFHQFCGQRIAHVEVASHVIHRAGDGTRYLVIHGDSCDIFGQNYPLLATAGAWLDSTVRGLSDRTNRLLRRFGRTEWTGIDRVLAGINDLIRGVDAFDLRLSALARARGADGIICGHFHKPALHAEYGIIYANCGDWVENTTALAETASGRLVLLDGQGRGLENRGVEAGLRLGATA